jgi:hypothetical protein
MKSPFKIYQNFLSPKQCEEIIIGLDYISSDVDVDNNPLKMEKYYNVGEKLIYDKIQELLPEIEQYYNFQYSCTEKMMFEWYDTGVIAQTPICENSSHVRKKWLKTKNRDISAILFLSDYNDEPPFDNDYEVYGGKLEFMQHGFGFNPQRGTLILYPSCPHFINATTSIIFGELYQVRIHIAASDQWFYNPAEFKGDYKTWFNGL